ncbi:putative membrane protein [Paenibacillus riograndensis SBR5]|uniref:Putative membrane protein n=1 Tax=Paenibacillus riograndensis SBR5 TaxID=1073571 RepID=A0A0E4HAG2_9BACL|nr:putative membrane protein [Paenibacillus riograndensis SBR5]
MRLMKKVSELHTELGPAPKDAMTGSPVTEIGYKRNGRTRRGGHGNRLANRGGTTALITALVLKMTILRMRAFLFAFYINC